MQKTIPFIVAIAASLSAGGCSSGAQSTTDKDSIADAIKAQDIQWAKDYGARDVKAINSHYASDGALAGPGYLATTDVDRQRILTAFMNDPTFKQTFSPDRVDVATSGDLAASRGQFSVMMTDPETKQPVTMPGTYLTIYKKDAGGSWRAIARFLTRGPVPQAAASAAPEQGAKS